MFTLRDHRTTGSNCSAGTIRRQVRPTGGVPTLAGLLLAAGLAGCSADPGTADAADDSVSASSTSTVATPAASAGTSATSPTTVPVTAPTTVPEAPPTAPVTEPRSIATDAPVTVAPTTGGEVFVTYSDWNPSTAAVEVGGYLADVSESDGTCTLTLSKGSATVRTSGTGISDATSTSCGGLAVPGASLSAGRWTAVLTYASASSRGTSAPVPVVVP